MIAHLRGTVHKLHPSEVTVDVQGVGYRVAVPIDVWEKLDEAAPAMLWISSYIREDRFDLYGFADRAGQRLFEELIKISGIGPKTALELCAVPRSLLREAAERQDGSILKNVKGIGRKTGEKLVLELRALLEKDPMILGTPAAEESRGASYDGDAIAALTSLGYDSPTAIQTLRNLPSELKTTEERVAAALRSL